MTDAERSAVAPGLARLGDHRLLLVGYGAVTMALGVVLVARPEASLVVVAVVLALQLLVNGIFQVATAFAPSSSDGGARTLHALAGVLSLVVGLLCLRSPLQTLLVIGLLIGGWWAVSGGIDLLAAMVTPVPHRAWRLAMGLVSLLAGSYLLVNPEVSLGVLVVVAALWLFGYGALAVVTGIRML